MSGFNFTFKQKLLIKRVLFIILATFWAFFAVLFFYRSFLRAFVYPEQYKETVLKHSEEFSLDKNLVFAVIKVESSFNVNAKSGKGAKGLMQITDSTANYIAQKLGVNTFDLFNEDDNVRFGCYYIRYLIDRFENVQTSICAYNAGEGRVREWLDNSEYSEDGKTLIVIPYEETREYTEKILKTFSKYEKLY